MARAMASRRPADERGYPRHRPRHRPSRSPRTCRCGSGSDGARDALQRTTRRRRASWPERQGSTRHVRARAVVPVISSTASASHARTTTEIRSRPTALGHLTPSGNADSRASCVERPAGTTARRTTPLGSRSGPLHPGSCRRRGDRRPGQAAPHSRRDVATGRTTTSRTPCTAAPSVGKRFRDGRRQDAPSMREQAADRGGERSDER